MDDHRLTWDVALKRVGLVLNGQWSVQRLLAVGGTAAVYEGSDPSGRRVALKILHPTLAADKTMRERFRRESYIANQIGHPGATSILGDGASEDGKVYLVMELLAGASVETLLESQGGRQQELYVLAWAEQVLDMLSASHRAGVIHRDIKPGNIFLSRTGRAKVLDFGLARIMDPDAVGALTGVGMVMGTPAYMSPEQARAQRKLIDARSDIFSVGAVMFRSISGISIHKGGSAIERMLSAMRNPWPPLASSVPEAHPLVVALVDKALAMKQDARWQEASAMRQKVIEAMGLLASSCPELRAVPADELSAVLVQNALYASMPQEAAH